MNGGVTCDVHGLTHPGRQRSDNQDQFLIAESGRVLEVVHSSLPEESLTEMRSAPRGQLLLVADGVGGHAGGGEASTLAVRKVTEYVAATMPWLICYSRQTSDEAAQVLQRAVAKANAAVLDAAQTRPGHAGMGTTLTMCYVVWPLAYVVHVGDSRCYLLRDGRLYRLTRDQTVANKLVEERAMSPKDLRGSHLNDILVNVVGGDSDAVQPAIVRDELMAQDGLLICSDGLTKHVPDAEIHRQLATQPTSKAAAESLVATANENGGSDNITVVVARYMRAASPGTDAHGHG
jgi:serine/threonine protein phosphatase PrpC